MNNTINTEVTQFLEQAKLIASDGVSNDEFGVSVSITDDGSRMAVGAWGDDSDRGSVYIYLKSGDTWIQEAKILAADGAANDQFGESVSITGDGSRMVVGARGDDFARGSAYIYVRSGSTWTQEAKIVASDGTASSLFGYSVSITGDGSRVVVGAWGDDSFKGAAYVYVRSGSTWTQEAKIVAADGVSNQQFGWSVSTTGDGSRVVVGAWRDDSFRGSAYVYVRSGSTWTQEAKIIAADGTSNDHFGWSVSITGDGSRVVVGAYGSGSARGSAYVYVRSGTTWTQEAEIVASDGAASDWFGWSVSITGDGSRVVVGAYVDDSFRGSAYVFVRSGTTWTQEAKIIASDGVGGDYFGVSVSITDDGSRVAVGAWGDDSARGSAYIYQS